MFDLKKGSLLIIALVMAAAGSAQAVRFGPPPSAPADVALLARFSKCVAHRWPARAERVLALDYQSRAYEHELHGLAAEGAPCLGQGTLRFGGVLFAGGMAEELLRARGVLTDLAPHVAYDPARPAIAAHDEAEVMSLCLARTAPAEVAALLQTEVGAPAEAQAQSALMPRIAGCLAAGQQVRVNPLAFRALLALAAYHLSALNAWQPVAAPAAAPIH